MPDDRVFTYRAGITCQIGSVPTQQTHTLTFDARTVAKRYLSWGRDEPKREWAGLTLLNDHAPGLAPEPLWRGERDGAPVVVMSRLGGQPPGDRPLTPQQMSALGDALRMLFATPVDAVRDSGIGERVAGPSSFPGSVLGWASTDIPLDECQDIGLVAEAQHSARDWLRRCSLGALPEEQVLGSGDGNVANVLWDGETCRLVDFEDCGLSDRAFELADIVEHASVRLRRLMDANSLSRAVGLTPGEEERWRACRPVFACFWLMMLMPGSPGFARNPGGSLEDQARHVLTLLDGDPG